MGIKARGVLPDPKNRFDFARLGGSSGAQGTIEYLVIVAVIIVVALVVVSLTTTIFGSPVQTINSGSSKLGSSVGSNGISIIDAAVDSNGDGGISLRNNSGGDITLNRVSVGGSTNLFDKQINSGGAIPLSLSGLSSACPCNNIGASRVCTFVFTYTDSFGLSKTARVDIPVDCVGGVNLRNPDQIVAPIVRDVIAPRVFLLSPLNDASATNPFVEFDFNVSDNNAVKSCHLDINGADKNTLVSVTNNSINSIDYNLGISGYGSYYWDVNCVDFAGNSSISASFDYNYAPAAKFIDLESCWDNNVSPHHLCDCLDLNKVRTHLDWNYVLENNIDCNDTVNWGAGTGFLPIGDDSNKFTGSFDGADYNISGLFINHAETSYVGLFGYVFGGKIKSVGLLDENIGCTNVGGDFIGNNKLPYAGVARFSGPMSGGRGGLVGVNDSSVVTNSFSNGCFTVPYEFGTNIPLGSLVGYNMNSSVVSGSFASGSVTGRDNVGGLVGYNADSNVSGSFASGSVTGQNSVGGLIGYNYDSNVVGSFASGVVVGSSGVGGLVGINESSVITDSFAMGNVGIGNEVGGLVGGNVYFGVVSGSFASGGVVGTSDVGGLIGNNGWYSVVSGSFASGGVVGTSDVGGLIGNSESSSVVNSSFAAGSVAGDNYVGGLVGYDNGSSNLNDYWDINRSTQKECCGFSGCESCSGISDVNAGYATWWYKPSKQPMSSWNPAKWVFNDNNYPILAWQSH